MPLCTDASKPVDVTVNDKKDVEEERRRRRKERKAVKAAEALQLTLKETSAPAPIAAYGKDGQHLEKKADEASIIKAARRVEMKRRKKPERK